MKSRTLIAVLAMGTGGLLGSATSGVSSDAGTQQCYYRPGIDPDSACTRCSEYCLGTGFRCCNIFPDLQLPE